MKKLIAALMSFSILGSTLAYDVSCNKVKTDYSIAIITGGDAPILDSSYNQQVYESVDNFNIKVNNKKNTVPYAVGPRTISDKDIIDSYDNVYNNDNVNTVALVGFRHNSGKLQDEYIKRTSQGEIPKTTLVLDAAGSGNEQTIVSTFRAEMAGFYAGITSIIYSILSANYNHTGGPQAPYNNNEIKLGTYGGIVSEDTKQSVINYMSGFLAATYVYNMDQNKDDSQNKIIQAFGDYSSKYLPIDDPTAAGTDQHDVLRAWFHGASNIVSNAQLPPNNSDAIDAQHYQSGTFMPGGGVTTINWLYNKNVNVLMPVAGHQTGDALLLKRNRYADKNIKIIGVDSDAVPRFPSYNTDIITSAEKPYDQAVKLSLVHSNEYFNNSKATEEVNGEEFDNLTLTDGNNGDVIKLDDNKSLNQTWGGKDIYYSTQITHGFGREIGPTFYSHVKSAYSQENVFKMSLQYMNDVKTKKYYELLGTEELTKLAKIIYGSEQPSLDK